jgi:hypothetical protein
LVGEGDELANYDAALIKCRFKRFVRQITSSQALAAPTQSVKLLVSSGFS